MFGGCAPSVGGRDRAGAEEVEHPCFRLFGGCQVFEDCQYRFYLRPKIIAEKRVRNIPTKPNPCFSSAKEEARIVFQVAVFGKKP